MSSFTGTRASLVSTENSKCSDNQTGSGSFPLREDFSFCLGMNPSVARTESSILLHEALPWCVPSPLTQVRNFRMLWHQPKFEDHCHAPWPWEVILVNRDLFIWAKLAALINTHVKTFDCSWTGENSPMNKKNGI